VVKHRVSNTSVLLPVFVNGFVFGFIGLFTFFFAVVFFSPDIVTIAGTTAIFAKQTVECSC
jgi:hypothetical protein